MSKVGYLRALFKNMLQWAVMFVFPVASGGTQHAHGPYASS